MTRTSSRILIVQGDDVESMWARPLGSGRYRLDNVPFQVYGFSLGDVVEARAEAEDQKPLVTRLIAKSGHRTLRVLLARDEAADESLQRQLRELGCGGERGGRLLAVDVPAAVDVDRVEDVLVGSGLRWEHADPTHDQVEAEREAAQRLEMGRRLPVLADAELFPRQWARDLYVEDKLLESIGVPRPPLEIPLAVRMRPLLSAIRRRHGDAESVEERRRSTPRGPRSELVHRYGRIGLVVPRSRPYRVERLILLPPAAED